MLLAFLTTQHHNLHMLLVSIGMGAAGASLLSDPLVRSAMLGLSVVALGMTAYQVRRHWSNAALRTAGLASAVVTIGMLAWSVAQFGL
jgi:hypothetical protein